MLKLDPYSKIFLGGTIAFLIIFLFTVVRTYDLVLEETQRNHQFQQIEMVKTAAAGTESFLSHLSRELHLLASFPGLQYVDEQLVISNLNRFLAHSNPKAIRAIFVSDITGNIHHSTADTLPHWIFPLLDERLMWANNPENWDRTWYSTVRPFNSDYSRFLFAIVVPVVRYFQNTQYPHPGDELVGLVGFLVDFDWLMEEYLKPIELGRTGFAWLIDGKGRLLFHTTRSKMVRENMQVVSSNCLNCHQTFEIHARSRYFEMTIGEYTIGDKQIKLLANVPLRLENEKWSIVLSTDPPSDSKIFEKRVRKYFLPISVAFSFIFIIGLLLLHTNIKRVRAERANIKLEEMRELQRQLDHSTKLASIGELVDSVAHELNTPAGIIAAHTDAMLLQNDSLEKYSEELNIIRQQTRRISKYIRSLLGYSKRMPFQPQLADISDICDESIYLIGHRFRAEKIAIKKNYSPDLPKVQVDRGQMLQVFVNLLNNAIDALSDQGEIKINIRKSKNDKLSEKNQSAYAIQIDIIDNGKGIPAKNLENVFDSFFSTKPPSKGTGLGLSISKAIILRHHGIIEVESIEGKGTTFHIWLSLNLRSWDRI